MALTRPRNTLAAAALALLAATLHWPGRAKAEPPAKPSIVLIVTDDQETSLVDLMPNVKALIADEGTSFAHAYYNDPLCCPSRATILTGKYGIMEQTHLSLAIG